MSFAAAIVSNEERRIVERFRAAGITTLESGRPLDELGGIQPNALRRLVKQAVIRESPAGSYYLDEARWSTVGSTRRRIAWVALAVAALVGIVLYLALIG